MKKIKILIVAGAMGVGGIENQLMHLLRQADKTKFQIDFTSTDPEAHYLPEIRSLGGAVHLIPRAKTQGLMAYCRGLWKVLRTGEYDIIHSHELFHSGIVLLLARLAGVPHRFVHAHNWSDGSGRGGRRPLKRRIYNAVMGALIRSCATCRIACSTLAGQFLFGADASFELLRNSVDTARFLDRYDDAESGEFTGDGWSNILQVGRITPVKNQRFLVDVAAELRRRKLPIRILCAGPGEGRYPEQVARAIADLELERHIRLLGTRTDIDSLMRKSAAFVLPSKYEGMPLVLIEAQASGLPCIAADTFSHEVDFGIGTLTWLPEDADAARWAEAIETAAARDRAGKAQVADAVAAGGFDSRCFARKLCCMYESAVGGAKL